MSPVTLIPSIAPHSINVLSPPNSAYTRDQDFNIQVVGGEALRVQTLVQLKAWVLGGGGDTDARTQEVERW